MKFECEKKVWSVLTACATLLAAGPPVSLGLLYLMLHMIPLIVILALRCLPAALSAAAIALSVSFLVWGHSSWVDWMVFMLPGLASLPVMEFLLKRSSGASFGTAPSGLTAQNGAVYSNHS